MTAPGLVDGVPYVNEGDTVYEVKRAGVAAVLSEYEVRNYPASTAVRIDNLRRDLARHLEAEQMDPVGPIVVTIEVRAEVHAIDRAAGLDGEQRAHLHESGARHAVIAARAVKP